MTEGRRYAGTPTMADVVGAALEDRLRSVHTALPGEVMAFDASTQTATVKPTVYAATLDEDGRYVDEPLPEIYDVPVAFPRTAAGYITFPVVPGDTVLLVFCERSIGQWRYTGQAGSPGDQRAHRLSGAVAIPGLYPSADKLPASAFPSGAVVVSGTGSNEVRLGSPTATDFVALSTKVDLEVGKLWTALAAHTHVVTAGAPPVTIGTATPPVVANTAAPTAATKVKAV